MRISYVSKCGYVRYTRIVSKWQSYSLALSRYTLIIYGQKVGEYILWQKIVLVRMVMQ